MLEEGSVPGPHHLMQAAIFANHSIVKALATAPGVMIDAQASAGCVSYHNNTVSSPLTYICIYFENS